MPRALMISNAPGRNLAALLLIAAVCLAGCSDNSAPPAGGPILIVPNQSVGQIKAGMTPAEVVALLGEPDRKHDNTLEYSRLGLAVKTGADGHLESVMCGDVVGVNGPFVKAFQGRTKEGVGMLSTRNDVIKAYGEPSATKTVLGGMEGLQYDAQGMVFTLEGGKVHHIAVRLGAVPEPDRTVLLQPAPPEEKK